MSDYGFGMFFDTCFQGMHGLVMVNVNTGERLTFNPANNTSNSLFIDSVFRFL